MNDNTFINTSDRVWLCASFNPIHEGHLKIAKIAHQKTGKRVTLEVSGINCEKGVIPHDELTKRITNIRNSGALKKNYIDCVTVGYKPKFYEKAAIYNNGIFVMGVDTYNRTMDKSYYTDKEWDEYVRSLDKMTFMVFLRQGYEFAESVYEPYLKKLIKVRADEYQDNGISSSKIRNGEWNNVNNQDSKQH